jgi:hypothetical protein
MSQNNNSNSELKDLMWYKKYVPLYSIILGVLAIVVSFFVDLPRTRGLYIGIALGPIVVSLIAYLRYGFESSNNALGLAKVIVETAWMPLSFGVGYFVMAPSTYYAAPGGTLAIVLIIALLMVILGLRTLIALSKKGYELTP